MSFGAGSNEGIRDNLEETKVNEPQRTDLLNSIIPKNTDITRIEEHKIELKAGVECEPNPAIQSAIAEIVNYARNNPDIEVFVHRKDANTGRMTLELTEPEYYK